MKNPKKEKNLRFINGRWIVDFTKGGKRIRQFAGFSKGQARNTLARMIIDKLDEKLGLKRPGKSEDVPFEKFADDFLALYSKPNKKSWQRDEYSLKSLKEFFKGETLQGIGAQGIERYKAKRQTEVSPATVNRELACLKTLLNKACEWGHISASPASRVRKLRENNGRERILSSQEAGRLIECASPEIKPILIMAFNTGMRRNEILSLKWADLDFTRASILIGDSKSGRSRKIPMNGLVFEVLKALPRTSDFIFSNPETKTHIKDIKTGFKSACKKAKISGVRLHDLRHTAASKMIEAGIDLATVSKILGHASIQMTMRYTHPTPESMKLAVEKLGEILAPTRQKVDMASLAAPASMAVKRSESTN
jgi:integrase